MKLARILIDGEERLCTVDDDELVPVALTAAEEHAAAWLQWSSREIEERGAGGRPVRAEDAQFLAPVQPTAKIIAVGLNYYDHAAEADFDPPAAPLLFSKTSNALTGHGAVVDCPPELTTRADYEAELAVVIGRRASRVSEADAMSHVFGYSVANDISARDAQFADGQWFRGKNFDGFCPIGPYLTLADSVPDVMDLRISASVNGERLQDDRTSSMIFGVPALISYISRGITLLPGDVILTGTPSGVGFAQDPPRYLRHGDSVEVEVEGLGCLRNEISASSSANRTTAAAVDVASAARL